MTIRSVPSTSTLAMTLPLCCPADISASFRLGPAVDTRTTSDGRLSLSSLMIENSVIPPAVFRLETKQLLRFSEVEYRLVRLECSVQ